MLDDISRKRILKSLKNPTNWAQNRFGSTDHDRTPPDSNNTLTIVITSVNASHRPEQSVIPQWPADSVVERIRCQEGRSEKRRVWPTEQTAKTAIAGARRSTGRWHLTILCVKE